MAVDPALSCALTACSNLTGGDGSRPVSTSAKVLRSPPFAGELSSTVTSKYPGEAIFHRYEQVVRFIKVGMLMRPDRSTVKPYLSRTDVEAFAAPVGVLKVSQRQARLMPMTKICSVVKAPVSEIYRHFLDGRFTSARRAPEKIGIGALLLDPEDVKRNLPAPPVPDPTMIEVAKRLRSNTKIVRYLAECGELRLYASRDPVTRTRRIYVDAAKLRRFQKEFVTVGELTEIFGRPSGPLSLKLDAQGLRPRTVPAGVGRIYRRTDIEQAVGAD